MADTPIRMDRPPSKGHRRWQASVAAGLFLIAFAVYNLNFREVSEDDTMAVRFLPLSVLVECDLDLDEFGVLYEGEPRLPYYLKKVGEHYYSRSPFMPAVMALPIYWVAMKTGFIRRGGFDLYQTVNFTSKVAASAMAAASVAVMFLALMKVTGRRKALILALVYAFATNTWAVSSQGLWQHAPSQLWISLAWFFLLPRRDRPGLSLASCALAGFAMGLAYSVRPATVPLGLICLVYCFGNRRRGSVGAQAASHTIAPANPAGRVPTLGNPTELPCPSPTDQPTDRMREGGRASGLRAISFALAFVAAALPTVIHNVVIFDTIQGGYADLTHSHPQLGVIENPWGGRFWEGLLGLLFSPNRGLFVYTPVCLFSFAGCYYWWRRRNAVGWYLLASFAVVIAIGSKFFSWWAGWSFGPRYVMDTLPVLVLLMAAIDGLIARKRWRIPFAILTAYSVAIQAIGAWCYPAGWNWSPVNVDRDPSRLWDWRDTQLRRCLTNGPQPTFWYEWSRDYGNLALKQFDARSYTEAAQSARKAIEINPANYRAHNTLGNVEIMRRRLPQAEAHYRDALRSNPTHAEAHSNLAVCLTHRNAFDEAETHVRRAISLDPNLALAHRNLGDICANTNRPEEAIQAYSRALALNPHDAHSAQALSSLKGKAGRETE